MHRHYQWTLWRERLIRNSLIVLPLALLAVAVAVVVAG
jgi:ERCC4-related helicase